MIAEGSLAEAADVLGLGASFRGCSAAALWAFLAAVVAVTAEGNLRGADVLGLA